MPPGKFYAPLAVKCYPGPMPVGGTAPDRQRLRTIVGIFGGYSYPGSLPRSRPGGGGAVPLRGGGQPAAALSTKKFLGPIWNLQEPCRLFSADTVPLIIKDCRGFAGTAGWTRTTDLLIHSQQRWWKCANRLLSPPERESKPH
jgi:hypothetical protein